jgi:hypothetical protein
MKITSIDTLEREDEPLVALIPQLEDLPSRGSDAGFNWRDGELDITGFAAPPDALDILDLPYTLDLSTHLPGLVTDEQMDFSRYSFKPEVSDNLSLIGLPGFSQLGAWNVAAVDTIGDGFAEIALTRPDGGSLLAATYEDYLPHLETGRPVLGIEKLLRDTKQTASVGEASVHTPIGLGRKYALRLFPVTVDFVPDQPPKFIETWLPLARVHCPKPHRCRAEFSAGHTETSEKAATLDVLGGGASHVHKVKMDQSEGLSAEPGECAELVVPGVLRVESGTTRVAGDIVAYGLRLTMESLDKRDVREQRIPVEYDDCGWEADQLPPDAWCRNRTDVTSEPGNDPTFRQEIERETTGTLSVGLKFNQVPINLGIGFKRISSQRDIVSAWLAPGAAYAAYHPGADRTMEWCWTTR